jgi:peptide/nickel transport system permease protein
MTTSTSVVNAPIAPKSSKTGLGRRLWRSFKQFPMVYIGGFIILLLVFVAVFAPYLSHLDPKTQFPDGLSAEGTPIGPSSKFIWGTDDLGRDIYTRILYGARISLEVGILSTLISLVIGMVLGIISGFYGGWIDTLIMRITDTVLAFPFLLFAMALVSLLRPSVTTVFIAIGVLGWGTMARVVRGTVLATKEFEYVQAARALGASNFRIMFRIIMPNVFGPIIVLAALNVGFNILQESLLSFLGIGVQPPTPSWGNMLQEGLNTFRYAPWMIWFPGMALLVSVLGFNLLADGLRDILDPRNATH